MGSNCFCFWKRVSEISSIELIPTQKSKSIASTPKTNLLTFEPKEISHEMSGIICCACSISAISALQCALIQWRNDLNKIQEKNVTQKNQDLLIAWTPSFVSSSTSVSPGKTHYGSQDPWRTVAGEDRSGRPDKGTDLFEASDHYFHEQFMESFSSTSYSKLDDDRAWSSQEWKIGLRRRTIDQGDLIKLLGEW